jgi:hypothetical protein
MTKRKLTAPIQWVATQNRWAKVFLFGALLFGFFWAAYSFWRDAASWKAADIGDRHYLGHLQRLTSTRHDECVRKKLSGCAPLSFVYMRLDIDQKTGDINADISSPVSHWARNTKSGDALFLVIRSPVFRDPFSQPPYDKNNRVEQWIKLKEPQQIVGLIYWGQTAEARSKVMTMSAGAWLKRPFGSNEGIWTLYLARAREDAVHAYGARKEAISDMWPVDELTLDTSVELDVSASTDGLEGERRSLRLDGANWVDDGIGLFRISLQAASGVKAFVIFLLAFVSLPVFMLFGRKSHEYSGLELLGSLASFGAVRAIVVGDKLVPSMVDGYLGMLLVILAYMYLFARDEKIHL